MKKKLALGLIAILVIGVMALLVVYINLHSKSNSSTSKPTFMETEHATQTASQKYPIKLSEVSADAGPAATVAAYYHFLGKGDIAGAASVSSDPEKTTAQWTAYKARVGEAAFAAQFDKPSMEVTNVLQTSDAFLVVLSDGTTTYVNGVVKSENGYKLVEDPTTLSADTQAVAAKALSANQ
jgi:hypothetical protein